MRNSAIYRLTLLFIGRSKAHAGSCSKRQATTQTNGDPHALLLLESPILDLRKLIDSRSWAVAGKGLSTLLDYYQNSYNKDG